MADDNGGIDVGRRTHDGAARDLQHPHRTG